ncbi:MAG: NUDIX hydrolase [Planctomycetota bacterium]|nr:NUDIX hydrolase [Planctomycetota bacterium]MCX8039774.1 NUDIX hydrolase [Planctomycetota bacterium]MDW8373154.1 NUDIX hydrolase [Planctomycetota bacterium]
MQPPRLLAQHRRWSSARFVLDEEQWETEDGIVTRPAIHHPGSVVILAEPESERLLMVRQWRYAVRQWTLEVPAGTCQSGEDPLSAAARELEEETGYAAERLRPLFRFWPAPGDSDELMTVVLAEGLRASRAHPDAGELVRPCVMARAELAELVARGEIADAKTLLALAWWGVSWRK